MTSAATPDLLAAIVAATRRRLDAFSTPGRLADLERRAALRQPDGRAFVDRLARPGTVNVIAECKRRSPSRGVLRPDYDAPAIAAAYERHGAAAVSVLTEPTFFDGALDHLRSVRDRVGIPLLRKDFIVDDRQLVEARAAGADAVLLIVSALEPAEYRRLHACAIDLGLAVLVEIHGREEVEVALAAGPRVVGVNNRNLRTLDVDRSASLALVEHLPDEIVAVAESGIRSRDDVRRLREAGFDAFLVGERLVTQPDPGQALSELM